MNILKTLQNPVTFSTRNAIRHEKQISAEKFDRRFDVDEDISGHVSLFLEPIASAVTSRICPLTVNMPEIAAIWL